MPLFPLIHEMIFVPSGLAPFGMPELQKALHNIMEAASEATRWAKRMRALNSSIMGKGYPSFSGGASKAPFDVVGDSLRGTAGVMMDMYRHPDELQEACERLTPFMVRAGIEGRLTTTAHFHTSTRADGFMSDKQFQTFYRQPLKKVIIGSL
jgi:hypothetical protein